MKLGVKPTNAYSFRQMARDLVYAHAVAGRNTAGHTKAFDYPGGRGGGVHEFKKTATGLKMKMRENKYTRIKQINVQYIFIGHCLAKEEH